MRRVSEGLPPVIRAAAGSALRGRIEEAARRLGLVGEIEDGDAAAATIGDRAIPEDAPDWHVEAALLRTLAPKHVLFLCVANSARSQMAEGLARAVAPDGVRISSAGSVPTRVRPQAIEALAEVGIDIRHHVSTGVDDVEGPVDAVVTLCAEEVCPVWLGTAWRLHWGLPDPAGAGSTPEEEMQAFRSVRDELRRRFEVLFG